MTTFFAFITQHKRPPHSATSKLLLRPLVWQAVVLYALLAATAVAGYLFLIQLNDHFLVTIPANGGTVTEGVIGAPQLINPLLATTDTDVALTTLVYSGLMKDTIDGPTTDLASSYNISPDGTVYTFILPTKLAWSDGKPLTSADIAFTIELESRLNPLSYWRTISVDTPNPTTVVLTLPRPDSDFLSRATLGIMPAHIWSTVPDEALTTAPENLKVVGSGPFKVVAVTTENEITTSLTLKRNEHYAHRRPYITKYRFSFFANEQELQEALRDGSIDIAFSTRPYTDLSDSFTTRRIISPVQVGIVHLPGEVTLSNSTTLSKIQQLIDKDAILATVENGYALDTTLSSPHSPEEAPTETLLSFSMAVENAPDSLQAARALTDQLKSAGIHITIKAFDRGIFWDGVQRQQYPIALVATRDTPPGYQQVLPLYTENYIVTSNKTLRLTLPDYLASATDRYRNVTDWHTRYNKVWSLFSDN